MDAQRIHQLYADLGAIRAEDILCRAVEELAQRLFRCEGLWNAGDVEKLGICLRALISISNQIGLVSVKQVAADVLTTLSRNDTPAISATLSRLMRVGEASLSYVWDVDGLSG